MKQTKRKRGRPQEVDVVQHLIDHPELRNKSFKSIADKLGVSWSTVNNQIAQGILAGKLYVASSIQPVDPTIDKRTVLIDVTSANLISNKKNHDAHRAKYINNLSDQERRDKLRSYRYKWLETDPTARETQNRAARETYRRMMQDPERYAQFLAERREYQKQYRRQRRANGLDK